MRYRTCPSEQTLLCNKNIRRNTLILVKLWGDVLQLKEKISSLFYKYHHTAQFTTCKMSATFEFLWLLAVDRQTTAVCSSFGTNSILYRNLPFAWIRKGLTWFLCFIMGSIHQIIEVGM